MKKIFFVLLLVCASCKPETYKGPLDMPTGTWKGVWSEYLFNGEIVAEADSCIYPIITFYDKYGVCCIEGVKGEMGFAYDPSTATLQIDSTLWTVGTLTGVEMIMTYTGMIYPQQNADTVTDTEEDSPQTAEGETEGDGDTDREEDGNGEVIKSRDGLVLPIEYKGVQIYEDANDYYFTDSNGDIIYCRYYGKKNASGGLVIDFWYDTHTDRFVPYNGPNPLS